MITAYQNARLVDASGERAGCVYTENGKILRVSEQPCDIAADRTVDAGGDVFMPALIDMHTHLRDPGFPEKETLETGMRAALHGGYATLCAMANTKPVCETPAQVEENHTKAEALRLCRLVQGAAAGVDLLDKMPTDYAALSRVTRIITNDGNTIFSDAFMRNLLIASREYGFVISTHCQPERKIVARDIALLREVGGNLHVGHISHAETLAMIRSAKAEGLALTCEVTPHHLLGYDCDYRVNPPLRGKKDVEALIEGVRDGTIDILSTDHAPHTPADKQKGMAGISNIDYALQVYLRVFAENDIPLSRLSEMTSYAPAKRLGFSERLLQEGCPADLVLFQTDCMHTLGCDTMVSRSRNTPFLGENLRGCVKMTIVEGEIRYEHR